MPVHRRTTCRLCGSTKLSLALNLAPTPPANAFVGEDMLGQEQARYPLDVYICEDCAHVQLLDVVDPAILFRNYVYVSGTSPSFVHHFQQYAEQCIESLGLRKGDLVVDIGSNDGTLLRFFKDAGMRVVGVDPAVEIAEQATRSGIPTLPEFLDPELATRIVAEHGPAALVTANNVFAHTDDLRGFAENVRTLLAPHGSFIFEVSYLVDVLQKTLFDTIYHEHLAYHSVKPLIPFFQSLDMELVEAIRVPSHGGSLRGVVVKKENNRQVGENVTDAVRTETDLRSDKLATFIDFARNIESVGRELRALLQRHKDKGRTIAGFGAPAKATTLMYHFGIGPETIDFIVDDSPIKQALFTPGMHIPVLPSSALYERRPEAAVILAWNFATPIINNHQSFLDQGGTFIVPLPKVEVHSK